VIIFSFQKAIINKNHNVIPSGFSFESENVNA